MTEQPALPRTELRRPPLAAGLPLSGLVGLAHYGEGYLSKVEIGPQPPPPELARNCDGAIDAFSSATTTTDLRRLARLPGRFRTATSVRELRPHLTTSPRATALIAKPSR